MALSPSSVAASIVRAACLALAVLLPAFGSHWRKLSGPMPRGSLGDVKDFQFVPGQDRVVYLADPEADEVFELYSRVLTPGASAIRLHPFPGGSTDVFPGFQVDPSGRRVIFTTGFRLYSPAPVDGGTPPIFSPAPGGTSSPDAARLVYTNGSSGQPRSTLDSIPSDSSTTAVSLAGSAGELGNRQVLDFAITADSTRVVFLGDRRVTGDFEVYSVPIDGSAPMKPLNESLLPGRDVTSFRVRADGLAVVYRADEDADERFELFRAPVDGSTARVRVTPVLPADRDVAEGYRISPDGAWLVFAADLDTALVNELYSVPLAGPAVAHKLSPPLGAGGALQLDLRISADSGRVVFPDDPEGDGVFELYSASLDGSQPTVRLFALEP